MATVSQTFEVFFNLEGFIYRNFQNLEGFKNKIFKTSKVLNY